MADNAKILLKALTKLVTPRIDVSYEIPYLAGYSKDGMTIYIDKRLPQFLKLKDGRIIDAYKYLIVHEMYEKHLEDKKGYKYQYAHEKATGKERDAVLKDKVPWGEYQAYMLKMVKQFQKLDEDVPKNIDIKPEIDSHDLKMIHEIKRWQ